MDKTKDSQALVAYFSAISKNEKTVAIDKIMEQCFVTRAVVYNWVYGHTRIPELYKRKIEEIFGAKIFTSFD